MLSQEETALFVERLKTLSATAITSTIIATYLLGALLTFECKIKRARNNYNDQHLIGEEHLNSLMRLTAICACLLAFLTFMSHVILNQLILTESFDYCNVVMKIDYTLTKLTFVLVYTFLWLRQRTFYTSPSTQHLTNRCTRFLSAYFLCLVLIVAFINPILYNTTQWFEKSIKGCKIKQSIVTEATHWTMFAIVTFCFHVILLALFLHPLMVHRSMLEKRHAVNGASRRTDNIVRLIRRAFVIALICVISDVLYVVVNVTLVTDRNLVPRLVSDGNILLNIFCIILLFTDWREKLIVCMKLGTTQAGRLQQNVNPSNSNSNELQV